MELRPCAARGVVNRRRQYSATPRDRLTVQVQGQNAERVLMSLCAASMTRRADRATGPLRLLNWCVDQMMGSLGMEWPKPRV